MSLRLFNLNLVGKVSTVSLPGATRESVRRCRLLGIPRVAIAESPSLFGVRAHNQPPGFSTRSISAATQPGLSMCSNVQSESMMLMLPLRRGKGEALAR